MNVPPQLAPAEPLELFWLAKLCRIPWRRKRPILLMALLGAFLGLVISLLLPRTYFARARVEASPVWSPVSEWSQNR